MTSPSDQAPGQGAASERVVVTHADAPWLPEGGRADVVLADPGACAPTPTCLARLLVTRRGAVLTLSRPDGRGLDIPTLRVDGDDAQASVRMLMHRTLGEVRSSTLLGYVRNTVPDAPDGYPWPSPIAHFAVWHCEAAEGVGVGTWLEYGEAERHLGERHWWPLAAHVDGLSAAMT